MNDALQQENAKEDDSLPDSLQSPRVRVPRLTSVANVRREMSRQYACHLRGEIGNKVLDVRIRALRAITESFVADDHETRIQLMEQQAEELKEKLNARA